MEHFDIKAMLSKGFVETSPNVWERRPEKKIVKYATQPIKIKVKALSVNVAWKGRRFKTPEYKKYEKQVLSLLPLIRMPAAPYEIRIKFFFSNRGSDVDNGVKLIVDLMQKKYNFNDREVYRIVAEKEIVKKGNESFQFMILPYVIK